MKILDKIDVSPKELWYLLFFPLLFLGKYLYKFRKTKIQNFKERNNNILWRYKIPLFKLKRNITKEDISEIKPLCRKCNCELRNDFSCLISKMGTYKIFKFICPNCNLVHDVAAESLEDFYEDLKRKLVYLIKRDIEC